MFEKRENLFKSVIGDFVPPKEWRDYVYLSEACKERFLTVSEIPEIEKDGFYMSGLAELFEGYEVERNGPEVHTLLFTVAGEGLLTTPKSRVMLPPNSLAILPAKSSFRFEINNPEVEWKMAWLLLSQQERWHEIADMGQVVVPFYSCEQVWSLMMLLHSEINGRPSYRKLLSSELSRLLTGVEAKPSHSTMRVQSLFNEIESQLHLSWTIKEIAEKCYLSEEQLNRISKSLFGCSPRSKLISLRMEKAANLLQYQSWTIAMIANRLGYKDPYNFTHRFRKYFGCSPRDYRKRTQKS